MPGYITPPPPCAAMPRMLDGRHGRGGHFGGGGGGYGTSRVDENSMLDLIEPSPKPQISAQSSENLAPAARYDIHPRRIIGTSLLVPISDQATAKPTPVAHQESLGGERLSVHICPQSLPLRIAHQCIAFLVRLPIYFSRLLKALKGHPKESK